MADFIGVDTIRSLDSELANSTIKVGEPAKRLDGGGVDPIDPDADEKVDFVVAHQRTGDHNEQYETDYSTYDELYTYEPAANKADEDWDDRVPLQPITDKDVVRALSVEDTSLTEPTFSDNDVVGFIAAPNGPRLVPEGYSDDFSGTATTYNEANGNFVAIGEVDVQAPKKTTKSGYGQYIPVRIQENL